MEVKYGFESLTLVENSDIGIYEDALAFVFSRPDIRNVAISGAYGSGKSSLLASYKNIDPEKKFIHISLAHFKSQKQENTSKNDIEKDVDETVLEGKILNQLIHQIPAEDIPQTNFRVKRSYSNKNIFEMTAIAISVFILFIYLLFFDNIKKHVIELPEGFLLGVLEKLVHPYAWLIGVVFTFLLLSFIVYKFIKMQVDRNVIRKLNLQGNQIEILGENDDSYFDKYLNEVLYIFEHCGADVIVFEDIDRFDANKIFERLREINTLANVKIKRNSKQQDKTLRFFYLLRDDIFTSKDRTKFFDYIIPVVPIMDSSNSYDQIITILKKNDLIEKFENNFLQGISLYIDDMRLLKNIYNEFIIYYNNLNVTELNCNKMFALMTYKNLFPRDFSDLQLNRGFVYTLFANKESYNSEKINELNEKKKELENAREQYQNADSQNYNEESKIHSLEVSINELENKLLDIKNKRLCDIITSDNINQIFSKITSKNEIGEEITFDKVKSNEYFALLKYLISNGYIDETYQDYMTYFYENSLSLVDKRFLRSVADRDAKEYGYKLRSPKTVVSWLKLTDFDQKEVLNFDLFSYLLETVENKMYLQRFIKQLENIKNIRFIGEYFDLIDDARLFIKHLNLMWPQFFATSIEEDGLTEEQIKRYSIFSIYYLDDSVIKSMNKDDCLRNYISNSRDYLSIEKPDIEKLINAFEILGVKFKGFDYGKSDINESIFLEVYKKSFYEINAENLKLMLKKFIGIVDEEAVIHRNYTVLLSNEESEIAKYINDNINEYFDTMLLMSDELIEDEEPSVLSLLNNEKIGDEQKQIYIKLLSTKITSLNDIKDSALWQAMLDNDVVKASEENIMKYFETVNLIDETLIHFINSSNYKLDFSSIDDENDVKEELFDHIILCNEIENKKYKMILTSLGFHYKEFNIADIASDKLMILMESNIVRMNEPTLQYIRANYREQVLDFIKMNIEKYVEIMNIELFSFDELLQVISLDIKDEFKIELLKFTDNEISIIDKNYSATVCEYILKNNFMESDLWDMFASYGKWNDLIKETIIDLAIENIEEVINNAANIAYELYIELIHSDRLEENTKTDLLIGRIPNLSINDIKGNLYTIAGEKYMNIFNKNSQLIKVSATNKRLLEELKDEGYIKGYKEVANRGRYYSIRRK